jgi:N-acetylmuramoyl-L-alanine amidase
MSKFIWVLDPGHGGVKDNEYQTKGKRSPVWSDGTQYFEGEGNRIIATKVANKLDKLDIEYIYTVEPEDPTDVGLPARVNFVNKLPYKNLLGVSLHSNGFGKESANGWEIWTSKGETTSDKIASIFYSKFENEFKNRKFRSDTKDGDVDKESNFYILKYTKCPFVLLENFFHTNEDECKNILMTEAGQDKIVNAIVESINFIELNGIK